MTSILSRLLTSDKPWSVPYATSTASNNYFPYQSFVPQQQQQPVVSSNSQYVTPNKKTSSLQSGGKRRKGVSKPTDSSVRFGRVPKREKAKILAAMQKVNASSQDKAICSELEDELRLLTAVVRAHEDTCEFTREKVLMLLDKASGQPVYTQCPRPGKCPLNPEVIETNPAEVIANFSHRFSSTILSVVQFAKKIPAFVLLSPDDQITLLRAGVFEVLLVWLACLFDSQANTLICLNGRKLRREAFNSAANARFILDSMFDFAERLNALHLAESEIALFSSIIVIAADRPGLRNAELVLKIQRKLMDLLQKSVTANHPENPNIFADLMKKIPDLRTLNTLHSEKILAFAEPKSQSGIPGTVESSISSSIMNPSIYASIPHDIWSQYSLVTTHPHCLQSEELRSSSPGQHSLHSGSSTGSEYSTTDSTKDDHDFVGSPRSVGSSGLCVDDAKSPIRSSSFSSLRNCGNEDAWSVEVHQNAEFQSLSRRVRDNCSSEHGSSSGDETYYVDSPTKCPVYPKLRRVDSPTDSGIESGKEHGTSTTPTTSLCSSPHSADEKVKDMDHDHIEKSDNIEDMPVLKRALQAPPLVNTNMLMDEAYRHHKKFRAARRESESPSSPSGVSLASTHSTLVKTLEQAPRYLSEQQLKRTDLIHNIIMRTETLPSQTHQSHPKQPQLQLPPPPPQEISIQSATSNGMHISVNGSCPYTSVPNSSSLPSHFSTNPHPQQKNMLVCPSNYYIPHTNASTNIYSNTPASWQFVGVQSSAATVSTTTVISPSSGHAHTQFSSNSEHSHMQQNGTVGSHLLSASHSPSPVTCISQAVSPRVIYRSRSPSSPDSPLVMNGCLPSATSPSMLSTNSYENRVAASSPPTHYINGVRDTNTVTGDSQPLNLSKKLFTPPMLKMES